MENDVLNVEFYFDNIVIIEIKRNCHFKEFNEELMNKLDKTVINKLSMNFVCSDFSIKKGTIYYKEQDNLIFNIYENDNKIYISQKEKLGEKINETCINLEYENYFSISTMNHDLNGSTSEVKTYISNENQSEYFYLDKITAFSKACILLDNLNKVEKLIDINRVCKKLNILLPRNYNPVISDEIITLSVPNEVTAVDIDNRNFGSFDIVLNDTKEKIGSISFDYYSCEIKYGNVSYTINKEFQNKGYATKALRLLVKLLKSNNFKGDKDLYFWVSYYNEFSKKVVINNGGEIISGGETKTKTPYMLRIKI